MDLSSHEVLVKDDVKIQFKDWDLYSRDDPMFHFWFNTGFVDGNVLVFEKNILDKACKDKNHRVFDRHFKVEVFLQKMDEALNLADERSECFEMGGNSGESEGDSGTDEEG